MVALQKILLGITLAAPIGPVSIEMVRRGLQDGFWGAFNIRLGGAIGNVLCLLAAFFGLAALQAHHELFLVLGLLGSVLLIYMGVTTLRKGARPLHFQLNAKKTSELRHPLRGSLVLGFMLAVFNPIGVMFWLTIFANSVDPNEAVHWSHLLSNFQIILGVLLWGAFLSTLLEVGRQGLNPRMTQWITLGSGCILLYFGAKYGYQNIHTLAGMFSG